MKGVPGTGLKRICLGKWTQHKMRVTEGGWKACSLCGTLSSKGVPEDVRFWSKVDIKGPDDCWLWKRALQTQGYGHLGFRGRTSRAHAVAYFLANGSIPGGLWSETCVIMHTCDVKRCCNPRHLRATTQKVNILDMVTKGRKAGCKLNPKSVRVIRERHRAGETCKALANDYGVSGCTMSKLLTGKIWRHVV